MSNPGPTADHAVVHLVTEHLRENPVNGSVYGRETSSGDLDGLLESIKHQGILVPLVVTPAGAGTDHEIISGHRRWQCARQLGLQQVPCEVRLYPSQEARERAVLEYNRYRRKTFSQMMREADLLEQWEKKAARGRRLANLRAESQAAEPAATADPADRRNSDDRMGRTDSRVAQAIGIGGKDLYRQARAVWAAAQTHDERARHAVRNLDAQTKTIHSAYKDLRRRARFTTGFRPTPYDVWSFRHDRAYGVPHPGSIPPGIVAHLLHYYTQPHDLVVDPMAGGGTTLDVCASMDRHCIAYDLHPVRDDVRKHDIKDGFPPETSGCDLVFADPPYFSMLSTAYAGGAADVSRGSLTAWLAFLDLFAQSAHTALRPGGVLALLLANQTEKDLPRGFGYLDHAFYGLSALLRAGFLPERRVSCPMSGGFQPQQVKQARAEGRLLGLVRDLLIVRKPTAAQLELGFSAATGLGAAAQSWPLGAPEASS